jgi:hypothetical protein
MWQGYSCSYLLTVTELSPVLNGAPVDVSGNNIGAPDWYNYPSG